MPIVFMSDISQFPDDYVPASIEHPDPEVMQMTAILMNADEECPGWYDAIEGATQGHAYYEETYRNSIARYTDMAVAVLAALKGGTYDIPVNENNPVQE